MASSARQEIEKDSQRTVNMQGLRDVTYQLLREFGLTTVFGNVGSTEEAFLKNVLSDFQCARPSCDETAPV